MRKFSQEVKKVTRHFRAQHHSKALCPLLYTNGWNSDFKSPRWWTDFVNHATDGAFSNQFLLEWTSVFGPRWIHQIPRSLPRVFFTPEATEYRYNQYDDHLADKSDLALGFKYQSKHANYIRFPLWLNYFLDSQCAKDTHLSQCVDDFLTELEGQRGSQPFERIVFCSLIASHDERGNGAGLRAQTGTLMESIAPVHYEGRFRKNSTMLVDQFQDDIRAYLKHSTFNICLENTNSPGYTTEKLFQSLLNGAIPIYWGSSNRPEPEVLTGNGIIFHDPKNPEATLQEVLRLQNDTTYREEFLAKPLLAETAQEYIEERIVLAKKRILQLIGQ